MCKQKDSEKILLIIPIKRSVDQNEDQVNKKLCIFCDLDGSEPLHDSLHLIKQILYEMATEMGDRDLLRNISGRYCTSIACQSIEISIMLISDLWKVLAS